MTTPIVVLGEALMDCIAQPDGTLLPLMGGSPYNMGRAAALQGADVAWLTPYSTDTLGQRLKAQAERDGMRPLLPDSTCPTSLAVVTVQNGQPAYGFYREGIADRDYTVEAVLDTLRRLPPGVLHTGSLLLIPPESDKVLDILRTARRGGWIISVDVNLRPMLARDLAEYRQSVMDTVALADWVKASDEDLHTLGFADATLERADALRQAFAAPANRHLAFTFGSDGAYLWADGHSTRSPAPSVDVVDTVGAGDTFWGTCLANWTLDPSPPAHRVEHTLHRAMRAAAINCSRKGCQPPRREEL